MYKVSMRYGVDASPLLFCLRNDKQDLAKYLLSQGASPNFIDENGISILMYPVGGRVEAAVGYASVTDGSNHLIILKMSISPASLVIPRLIMLAAIMRF